jgi:hypothetical protein
MRGQNLIGEVRVGTVGPQYPEVPLSEYWGKRNRFRNSTRTGKWPKIFMYSLPPVFKDDSKLGWGPNYGVEGAIPGMSLTAVLTPKFHGSAVCAARAFMYACQAVSCWPSVCKVPCPAATPPPFSVSPALPKANGADCDGPRGGRPVLPGM